MGKKSCRDHLREQLLLVVLRGSLRNNSLNIPSCLNQSIVKFMLLHNIACVCECIVPVLFQELLAHMKKWTECNHGKFPFLGKILSMLSVNRFFTSSIFPELNSHLVKNFDWLT